MLKLVNTIVCIFLVGAMSLPDASAIRDFIFDLHFEAYSEHNAHSHDNIADDTVTHEHTHKHGEDGEEHQHDHDHFSYKVSELRIVLNVSFAIEPIAGFNVLSGFSIDHLNSSHHPQQLLRPPIA